MTASRIVTEQFAHSEAVFNGAAVPVHLSGRRAVGKYICKDDLREEEEEDEVIHVWESLE